MTETGNDKCIPTMVSARGKLRSVRTGATPLNAPRAATGYASLTMIPWSDIWTSLKLAKHRGNGPMINAFYEMLFRDAIFDDRGAWSLKIPRPK